VLVAYTRTALAPGAPSFDEMLGDPGLDAAQVAFLQETIRDTGALDRVEALITLRRRGRPRPARARRWTPTPSGRSAISHAMRPRAHPDASLTLVRRATGRRDGPRSCGPGAAPRWGEADRLLLGEEPVDELVVAETGILQHDDRAAQRGQRRAVDEEDVGHRERAVPLAADEVVIVEQPADPPQRLAQSLDEFGQVSHATVAGVAGTSVTLHYPPLAAVAPTTAG
jgi:hypothetical protein